MRKNFGSKSAGNVSEVKGGIQAAAQRRLQKKMETGESKGASFDKTFSRFGYKPSKNVDVASSRSNKAVYRAERKTDDNAAANSDAERNRANQINRGKRY